MADITLAKLQDPNVPIALLKSAIPEVPGVQSNKKYVDGDHWQQGEGWVGPGPLVSDPEYQTIMTLIEKAFVSRNAIDEVIDRHVSAVLGKEPRWSWTTIAPIPEGEEMADADATAVAEIESALTEWWDNREAHRWLKALVYKMLWGKRSGWRLYVPAGLRGNNGAVSSDALASALGKIYLEVPEPDATGCWVDPDTQTKVQIAIWTDVNNQEHAEVTWVDPITGKTTINVLPAARGAQATDNTATNDFSRHAPIFVIELDSVWISEQMRSIQRSFNMSMTLLQKGIVDNGFLERIMLNALPPGHWEYEDKPDPVSGQKVRKAYVPERYETGGRMTHYAQGIDIEQRSEDGSVTTALADPAVVFREPVDPTGIIKGADYWYQAILTEARQDFVLMNSDATASGKSREQARGDFMDSTHDTQMQVERAGRELLVTIVAMVEAFMGKAGQWTSKYRPIFKCRTTYGPLSVEERAQNLAEAKDGFMADETAMALNGIDDVDAEQVLIAGQPRSSLALSKSQAEAADLWVAVGFTKATALHMVGLGEDEIKEIMDLEQKNKDAEGPEEPPVDPTTGLPVPPTPPNAPNPPVPADA